SQRGALVVAAFEPPHARERHRHDGVVARLPEGLGDGPPEEGAEGKAEGGAVAVLEGVLEPLHGPAVVEHPQRQRLPEEVARREGAEAGFDLDGVGAGEAAEARRAQRHPVVGGEAPLAGEAEGREGEAGEGAGCTGEPAEEGGGRHRLRVPCCVLHVSGASVQHAARKTRQREYLGGVVTAQAAPPFSPRPSPTPMPKRRGMLIKNVSERPLTLHLQTREIPMEAGDEVLVTAEEVRDATLREHLQVRSVAVVRPATEEEGEQLARELGG